MERPSRDPFILQSHSGNFKNNSSWFHGFIPRFDELYDPGFWRLPAQFLPTLCLYAGHVTKRRSDYRGIRLRILSKHSLCHSAEH